ncbi:MAG: iron-containing redox enzyme family protein [Candidatus Dormibacteria bacterium]
MLSEIPLLRRSATVSPAPGRVTIEYLDDQITLEGAGADLLGRLLPHFDGQTTLRGIATRVAEPPARVERLVSELQRVGVLTFLPTPSTNSGPMMTGLEFYALHRRYVSHWLRDVYVHPLWEKMVTGEATRAQVIGFAFEKYHYIEGAYEHMALAAANATPEMMPHLARHFIEEYMHGDIYRKGLSSLFPDELVLYSQPLPSTRALVNFLSECASRNSFGYYAGNELLQMTENTSDEGASSSVDKFYDALRKHYPYTKRLVDSFIAHTNADQSLGHKDVFHEMCASVPPLTPREVKDAMNIVKSMAEHLMLFLDGIDVFYGNFPTVPRTPCNLLSE